MRSAFLILGFIPTVCAVLVDIQFCPQVCSDRIVLSAKKPLGAVLIPQPPYEKDSTGYCKLFIPYGSVSSAAHALKKNVPFMITFEHVLKPMPGCMIIIKHSDEQIPVIKHFACQDSYELIIELQNKQVLGILQQHWCDARCA